MQGAGEAELKRVGHYEILEKIGQGGFGVVYIAHDPVLDRKVALKVLHPYHATEPIRVARFMREARSAAKLHHQGIVQVHDVVKSEGRMALIMEYVQGRTLDVYLKENPQLTLEQKLEIAAQIAEALDVAHEAGIIHRDVKPANVIIDESGCVKLTDFSLARLLDNSMTQITGDNNVLGTPAYMSPEQCQGQEAVPQSDLYALGVMIYEMTVGSLPFEAENYLALLRHHADTPPTPVRLLKPSLPRVLEDLIMRCLAKTVEKRPASGAELAQALRQMIKDGLGSEAHAATETVELESRVLTRPESPAQPTEELEAAPPAPDERQPEGGEPQEPARPSPETKRRSKPVVKAAVVGVAALVVIAVLALVLNSRTKDAISVSTFWSDTPLLDYVSAPDDNYAYRFHSEIPGQGYTAHVLDMTSQTWHADKANPPVWRHWLTIIAPEKVTSDKAMLVFSEGFSTAKHPMSQVPPIFLAVALTTKSVVAIVEGFPRDPVGFHEDVDNPEGIDRHEFAVASFMRFLDTGDPTWPIVCPLVKSAVRAMDTVQSYTADEFKLETPIESFVLTGEANGWATWLTGVVDDRVAAIAPIQFDLLNIGEQIEHQVGFRGELSPFLSLFSETDVMPALDTQKGKQLLSIIDPYEYRNELTMPKLLLLPGSSASFTTIDGANLFLEDLKGETYLFCAPNVTLSRGNPFLAQPGGPVSTLEEFGAAGYVSQDFRNTLQVFYHNLLAGKPMPRFTWDIEPDGSFKVVAEDPPAEARLWLARSESRDFSYRSDDESWPSDTPERADQTGEDAWQMEKLNYKTEGVYEGKVVQGGEKYTAFYIELIYPSKLGINFNLTTPTTVLVAQEKPSQVTKSDSATLGSKSTPSL